MSTYGADTWGPQALAAAGASGAGGVPVDVPPVEPDVEPPEEPPDDVAETVPVSETSVGFATLAPLEAVKPIVAVAPEAMLAFQVAGFRTYLVPEWLSIEPFQIEEIWPE